MPRGQAVFAKIEPEFALGRTEAGRALRSLPKSQRLAYYDLWHLAVDLRQDVFVLNRATEKTLLAVCDFSRVGILYDCLHALAGIGLVRVEPVEHAHSLTHGRRTSDAVVTQEQRKPDATDAQELQVTILYVREKHSGYSFRSSPNGERTGNERSQSTECRVKSIETTPQSPRRNIENQSADSVEVGGWVSSEITENQSPVHPVQPAGENAASATPESKNESAAADCPDTPAARLTRRLSECWAAVRSAFPVLGRQGVDDPAAVAEGAVLLQAEQPARDEAAALSAMAHYLEALGDPTADNPVSVTLYRARAGKPLRTDALARLRRLLIPGAATAQTVRFEPKEYTCGECRKTAIWSRKSPSDQPPKLCSACALAAGKRQMSSDALRVLEG